MNTISLQEAYSTSKLEEAKNCFHTGGPTCPVKYFNVLYMYLEPYNAFVKALFTIPDDFNQYPYLHTNEEMKAHPMVEKFLGMHNNYQSNMGKLHAALGIAGEVIELTQSTDQENFEEEVGDCIFYMVALLQQYQVSLGSLSSYYIHEGQKPYNMDLWKKVADKSLDAVKRKCIYGQTGTKLRVPEHEMFNAISRVFANDYHLITRTTATTAISSIHNYVVANIKKLIKRYPTLSFNVEDSYSRKDKDGSVAVSK